MKTIYFDNAATSHYKPKCVQRALVKALKNSANPGRSGHKLSLINAIGVFGARQIVAKHFGMKNAEGVIFTKNCTEALNLGLLGSVRPGGEVITTVWEHNSVLRPLSMLQKEGLIQLTFVGKNGKITANEIKEKISDKTYLVALTAMSNVTGYVPPLQEIGDLCSAQGIKLLLDGAQALGHVKIDVDKIGVDLLAGAGHKALHGIMGTGFLLVGKRTFLTPLLYGGTGTESDQLSQPITPPEGLEAGTLNLPGISALNEGLRWTDAHFDKINEHISELSFFLHSECEQIGIKTHSIAGSPIVTFSIKDRDSSEVADRLSADYKIAVRAGLHCAPLAHKTLATDTVGAVRASIGSHNTMKEAKTLVRALREIASTKSDK